MGLWNAGKERENDSQKVLTCKIIQCLLYECYTWNYHRKINTFDNIPVKKHLVTPLSFWINLLLDSKSVRCFPLGQTEGCFSLAHWWSFWNTVYGLPPGLFENKSFLGNNRLSLIFQSSYCKIWTPLTSWSLLILHREHNGTLWSSEYF